MRTISTLTEATNTKSGRHVQYIHPCIQPVHQQSCFAYWTHSSNDTDVCGGVNDNTEGVPSPLHPNLVTASGSTLRIYTVATSHTTDDSTPTPTSTIVSTNNNTNNNNSTSTLKLSSSHECAGTIISIHPLPSSFPGYHNLLIGFGGQPRFSIVIPPHRNPTDHPPPTQLLSAPPTHTSTPRDDTTTSDGSDDEEQDISRSASSQTYHGFDSSRDTLRTTSLVDLSTALSAALYGSITPLTEMDSVSTVSEPRGGRSTVAVILGGGCAVCIFSVCGESVVDEPYLLPLRMLKSRVASSSAKTSTSTATRLSEKHSKYKNHNSHHNSNSHTHDGDTDPLNVKKLSTGYGDILDIIFLRNYRTPTICILHGTQTHPGRLGNTGGRRRARLVVTCVGFAEDPVRHARSTVLWTTSAGMKGVVPACCRMLYPVGGTNVNGNGNGGLLVCGPNHLTWLNGGFGGLTGAQPSTHTHLGSNSWGGGSGLGVLGVRFNPEPLSC
mmetsp:Transcript_44069/g.52901  ORF Transcript_44069/g.52901 Transcript_44069/m.52901 type:complete len:496 (-) Transcript_44069:997-2484(-)